MMTIRGGVRGTRLLQTHLFPHGCAAIHGGSCFSPFRIGDQEFVQDQEQEGLFRLFLSVSCVHMFYEILACRKQKKSRQG
jgi:hypothetical protein